jgi:hypothetical protein
MEVSLLTMACYIFIDSKNASNVDITLNQAQQIVENGLKRTVFATSMN